MFYYFFVVKEKLKLCLKHILLFVVQMAFSRFNIGQHFPLGISFALSRICFGESLMLVAFEYIVSNAFLWTNFYLVIATAFEVVVMSLYYFLKETLTIQRKKLVIFLFLGLSSVIRLYFVIIEELNIFAYLVDIALKFFALVYCIKIHSVFKNKFIFQRCSNLDYVLLSSFLAFSLLGLFQYKTVSILMGLSLLFAIVFVGCRFLPTDKFLIISMILTLCFGYLFNSSVIVLAMVSGILLLVLLSKIPKYFFLILSASLFFAVFKIMKIDTISNIINLLEGLVFVAFIPQRSVNKLSQFFEEKNLDIIKENLWFEARDEVKGNLVVMSKTLAKMQEDFKALIVGKIDRHFASDELAKDVIYHTCETCDRRIICSSSLIDKQRMLSEFIFYAISKGSFSQNELSVGFRTYCDKTAIITNKIGELVGKYLQFESSVKTEDESKLLIADELGNFAKLLNNFAKNIERTPKINRNLTEIVKEMLINNMVEIEDIAVFESVNGIEKIDVVAKNSVVLRRELAQSLSRVVQNNVYAKKIRHLNFAGLSLISFMLANSLRAEFAVSSKAKEKVNGDNTLLVKIDDSRFLVAIADGMGHGKVAGRTSQMILELIKNMFFVGINLELIIESINKLLVPVGLENFSTLDVAVVDLRQCKCTFIKLGSSVSVIKHRENSELIVSSSLPVGIVQNLKPTIQTTILREGDMIVLASDGVVDCFADVDRFRVFVNDCQIRTLQEFTDNVIAELSMGMNQHPDDMSIIAVKLLKNSFK